MKEDTTGTEWQQCPTCEPEDNLWPRDSFTLCGNAYSPPICNGCWSDRYQRVTGKCESCGLRMRVWRSRKRAEAPLLHRDCAKAQAVAERSKVRHAEWKREQRQKRRLATLAGG
jgi:hypothetical protein